MTGAGDLAAWLREQVQARLELARKAALCGEVKDGRWFADDDLDDEVCDDSGWRILAAVSGSHVALHVEANDPRDTIARCEAELAILEQHQPAEDMGWLECRECGPNNDSSGVYARPGGGEEFYPCMTIRLLGTGYRHADGYREKWGP